MSKLLILKWKFRCGRLSQQLGYHHQHGWPDKKELADKKLRRSVMWLVTRLSKAGRVFFFVNVFFSNACNSLLSSQ